jgi:hypothetical protein
MKYATSASVLAIVVTLIGSDAFAERLPEKRENADIVVTGTVERVYQHESEGYYHYIVELKIEEVEKGENIQPGGTFRAFCYDRKPAAPGSQLSPGSRGHNVIPSESQRIRVFVNSGSNEGIYPDWADVLPAKATAAKAAPRPPIVSGPRGVLPKPKTVKSAGPPVPGPERMQKEATHIVTGKVTAIYYHLVKFQNGRGHTDPLVEILIDAVERGKEELKPADFVYARCYPVAFPDRQGPRVFDFNHARADLNEGDKVRAFLVRGTNPGNGKTDNAYTACRVGVNGIVVLDEE